MSEDRKEWLACICSDCQEKHRLPMVNTRKNLYCELCNKKAPKVYMYIRAQPEILALLDERQKNAHTHAHTERKMEKELRDLNVGALFRLNVGALFRLNGSRYVYRVESREDNKVNATEVYYLSDDGDWRYSLPDPSWTSPWEFRPNLCVHEVVAIIDIVNIEPKGD